MAGLTVNPADIQAFADMLEKRAGQDAAEEAQRYLARYATLPEETRDSLFGRVGLHHQQIYHWVSQGLHNIDKAAGGSAKALVEVKQAYLNTDAASAARIDATIPGTTRPQELPDPKASFTVPDPADQLKAPSVPDDYPDPLQPVRDVLNIVTGSGPVEYLVTQTLGWNPYERAGVVFAGDWHAFAQAGEAFSALGDCIDEIGGNIGSGNDRLGQTWHGNAADAAYTYFDVLFNEVSEFGETVGQLRQGYLGVADSAYVTSMGVADLLHDMTDDVTIVIATFASGGTAEIASKLLHILPEFAKKLLEKLTYAMAIAEILAGLARNIGATGELRDEASYIEPPDGDPYKPPKQLVD